MLIDNGTKVLVEGVLLAWDDLTKPDEKYNRFGGKFLWPKSDTQSVQEMTTLLQGVQASAKVPLTSQFIAGDPKHDGDIYCNSKGEPVPQYKGYWVVNATSGLPVSVLDESGNPVDLLMQKPLFPGVKMKVIFNAYPRTADGNKGTSIGPVGCMITDRTAPRLFEGGDGSVAPQALAGMFGAIPSAAPVAASPAPAPQAAAPTPAPAPAAVPRLVPTSDLAKANPDPASPYWVNAGWTEELLVTNGHFAKTQPAILG
jgi:hypothetical protein